jgi:hypothetical protein
MRLVQTEAAAQPVEIQEADKEVLAAAQQLEIE